MKSSPDLKRELVIGVRIKVCAEPLDPQSTPIGHPLLGDNMVQRNLLVLYVIQAAILMFVTAGVVNNQLIKKYSFNNNGLGTYSFEFESADGIYRKEDGGMVSGPRGEVLVVRGEYGYTDPEGHEYSLHYVADENGFQPQPEENYIRFNDRRIT